MAGSVQRMYGHFTVTFDDQPIDFLFAHMREASNGESLSAEVGVRSRLPTYGGLLHEKRLNLLSSQSQVQWANYLDSLTPAAKLPWKLLLEEACVLVKRAWREGDPAILLRDAPEPPAGDWMIPNLILANEPTIWFGAGSAGKSLLALAAGIAIHTGRRDILGVGPTVPTRVLLLDFEFSAWEHRKRLEAMSFPEAPCDLVYTRCSGSLLNQVERIQQMIVEHQIGFLIIDSVGFACGGEPESAASALLFFDALRQLKLGALCIAHETKAASHEHPFGSVFWHNAARMTWYVAKNQEDGENELNIGFFCKKSNTSLPPRPWGFRIVVGEGDNGRTTIDIRREDVRDLAGVSERVALPSRLIRLAEREGPGSVKHWAETTGEKEDTVRKAAERLVQAGKLVVQPGSQSPKLYCAVFAESPGQNNTRNGITHPTNSRADMSGHAPLLSGRTHTPLIGGVSGQCPEVSGSLARAYEDEGEEDFDPFEGSRGA